MLIEGGFLRTHAGGHHGPTPIADVVDWHQVVQKYLAMLGLAENHPGGGFDDMDVDYAETGDS